MRTLRPHTPLHLLVDLLPQVHSLLLLLRRQAQLFDDVIVVGSLIGRHRSVSSCHSTAAQDSEPGQRSAIRSLALFCCDPTPEVPSNLMQGHIAVHSDKLAATDRQIDARSGSALVQPPLVGVPSSNTIHVGCAEVMRQQFTCPQSRGSAW